MSQSTDVELFRAVSNNDEKRAEMLLRSACDPNFSQAGATLLMVAVQQGNLNLTKKLVQKGASVNKLSCDMHVLGLAVVSDFFEIAQFLISQGADVNGILELNRDITFLESAINNGHLHLVKLLVENGANISPRPGKTSPLILAVFVRRRDIVLFLLQQGADPNFFEDDLDSALHYATSDEDVEMMNMLFDYGADVNLVCNQQTALHIAVDRGSFTAVSLLLFKGANVETCGQAGETPLMIAVRKGNLRIVNLLLSHGADVQAKTASGTPLLISAVRSKSLRIVEVLLDHGVDVNCRGPDGKTALMLATEDLEENTVELLMQRGADLQIKDSNGKSVLDLCRNKNIKDILLRPRS